MLPIEFRYLGRWEVLVLVRVDDSGGTSVGWAEFAGISFRTIALSLGRRL